MGIIAELWLTDECVQLSVQRATGLRKLTGLIGRAQLASGTALRLARCRSVHGLAMVRTLDVVFVADNGLVTSVRRLAPWRVVGDRTSSQVFEMRAGEAARLGIAAGVQLTQSIKGES